MSIKKIILIAVLAVLIVFLGVIGFLLIQTQPWVEADFSGTVIDMQYNSSGDITYKVELSSGETKELSVDYSTVCIDYNTGDDLSVKNIKLGEKISAKFKKFPKKELMWLEIHSSTGARDTM